MDTHSGSISKNCEPKSSFLDIKELPFDLISNFETYPNYFESVGGNKFDIHRLLAQIQTII